MELDRDAGLHVAAAAAVQQVPVEAGREVIGDRHRVDVPGQHHPLRPAQRGPGDHGVAVPEQLQVRDAAQRGVDHVGQAFLITADRGYIYQGRGQGRRILGKVKI